MINDLMKQIKDASQLVGQSDLDVASKYMTRLREMGVTPSDVVDKGLRYCEMLVQDTYPDVRPIVRLELALYICEKIALSIGVHSTARRQQKLEEKK